MISLIDHDFQWGRSEVVIKFTQIYGTPDVFHQGRSWDVHEGITKVASARSEIGMSLRDKHFAFMPAENDAFMGGRTVRQVVEW